MSVRRSPALALLLALASTLGCAQTPPPTDEDLPRLGEAEAGEIAVVAEDLDTVWELAFGPDGRLFFTERGGTIHVIENGTEPRAWLELPSTVEQGESGLMGLALHPTFPEESYVYACQTHRDGEGELRNRVLRIPAQQGAGEPRAIVEGIDAGRVHDGCRLAFGPEAGLFVTMGDAADASRAQDASNRNGKVLRYTPSGEPAANGEAEGWHPAVFTLGHRNPQGLDFHPETGTPYVSEHGPENHDEVNVLREGANYGWPEVRGPDDGDGRYVPALWTSGGDATVAPAGAAFIEAPSSSLHGAFVVATLKEAQLHVFEIAGEDGASTPSVEQEHVLFEERFGRLRAATWGPDDALYLSTSNQDGRGTPGPSDDRILRVPLAVLEDEIAG